MYRLSHELADMGWRVISTTTTVIRPPSPEQSSVLVVEADSGECLNQVRSALSQGNPITVASAHLAAENKLRGIPPELVPALAQLADAVIVEADGARGRSVKAPAEHEPVMPFGLDALVPVAGIDAVGRELGEETAHRAGLVASLTGSAIGDIISPALLARLLVHPKGALKNAPAGVPVVPLINKVHQEADLTAAREVAAQIKSDSRISRVLIAAVAATDPVVECWRRVSAVVLAAGPAKRFGSPKQLLPISGTTMIEHVLHVVRATSVHEIVVVLGHAADQIADRVPSWCRIALNEGWQQGMSSSIRAGLEAMDRSAEAALFVLADQPQVTSEQIEHILRAYYGSIKPIVAPFHDGQRGTPVLFDHDMFSALRSLRGDEGGKQLIAQCADQVLPVQLTCPDVFLDIDTPADYERFLSAMEQRGPNP